MWYDERERLDRRNDVFKQSYFFLHLSPSLQLKPKQLTEICEQNELSMCGPLSRKDTYILPLLEFLQEYKCVI